MLFPHRRLATLGAVVLAFGGAACTDTSTCEAALAGVERTRAEAAQRDAQLSWLRYQLATFALELQTRNAADRDALLQKLGSLESANLALAKRLEQAGILVAPTPVTSTPTRPTPAPSPPSPRVVRQVDAKAANAHGIDEASPY
jgi:hypothetical protein